MIRRARRLAATVWLFTVLAVLAVAALEGFDAADRALVDARFAVRGAEDPDNRIVMVVIDDRSLQAVGEFPFPRRAHARVIDRLVAAGAGVIAYDIVFAEPGPDPDQDDRLIRSVQRAGNVVLAASETTDRGDPNVFGGDPGAFGATAGSTNLPLDPGGVVRRVKGEVEGLAAFSVAVARRFGVPPHGERLDGEGAPIAFAGPDGTYPSVSFSDVLAGTVASATFKDRIVVVGASNPNLQDVHATATTEAMAGPEIEANAISTVLRDAPLRVAPPWVQALLAVLFAAIAPLALRRAPTVRLALCAVVAVGVAYILAAQAAFDWAEVELPVAAPLTALLVAAVLGVLVAYVVVAAERDLAAERHAHELTASKLRAVEAADDARREVERNLHDGAQQQLMGIALDLGTTREQLRRGGVPDPDDLDALLVRSRSRVTDAVAELRALSRGTYPAALVEGGLDAGLAALLDRLPPAVIKHGEVGRRLDPRVEAVGYFFASEGVANALKHSGAGAIVVEIEADDRELRVAVRDDGGGGADPGGAGQRGLRERVEAHGGEVKVRSEPGEGTLLSMRVPLKA